MKRPRIRLSCRVADWLGETDLSLFKSYFNNSPYVVVSLEPLNESEVATILSEKGVEDTEEFIRVAQSHKIEGLLTNPQTLIMLQEVVGQGSWPETKRELYESSIKILLAEHNRERMGPGLGQYGSEELIASAGAACASILISGVSGISLVENNYGSDFPSYRSLPVDDLGKAQACLMRRAFSLVNVDQEAVSYIHRTIAEFIAAKWLTDKVRGGLPVRRIQSLICIEEHPAPELRGLHAWLATLLAEHSATLISNDPFGILMYGDPASLSLSYRKFLLHALEKLSKVDPWFRSGDWSDSPLGALSGPDMVESFQRILSDPNATSDLRSVVLGAIRNGPPLPEISADLRKILVDPKATYHDQSEAVDALLSVIPDGKREVTKIFSSTLSSKPSTARLRAHILSQMYTNLFIPTDVFSVFNDVLNDTNEHSIGELWYLVDSLPDESFPDILDLLCDLQCGKDIDLNRRNKYDVESAFSRMLARVLRSDIPKQPARLWHWLLALHKFCGRMHGGNQDDIRDWLSHNQPIVLNIFRIACNDLDLESTRWSFLYDFQNVTMHSLPYGDLAKCVLKILKSKDTFTDKECFLYDSLGSIVFIIPNPSFRDLFDEFFRFADGHKRLQEIRDNRCRCEIEDWRREDNTRKIEDMCKQNQRMTQNRANLEKTKESIRSGQHLKNLGWLAEVYFGHFIDIDNELTPVERLRTEIGDNLLTAALEGFSAVINRSELPSPTNVALLSVKGQYFSWWYAVLLGMDEEWLKKGALCDFSDTVLKSALAIAIEFPTNASDKNEPVRQWMDRIYVERPDLVQSVFEDIARVELQFRKRNSSVLYSIAQSEQTKSWRAKLALRLLSDFPSATPDDLRNMLLATIFDPECHNDLIEIAKATISTRGLVKMEQKAMWLATGFLLSNHDFQSLLMRYTKSRVWVIWTVKDIIEHAYVRNSSEPHALTISQYEYLIKLFGENFDNVSSPTSTWSGDQNPWNAAEFVKKEIDTLSANAERDAFVALRRLLNNDKLASYHNYLRHAIASQAVIRREAAFKQPSWSETIEVLRGGRPANIADLHALILDHLRTLKSEIRQSNTDKYKSFWRCDRYGAVDTPEIEDICRDRLIDLMKPHLLPLQIRVEPEGHMVADKRSDIVIMPPPGLKLPLELKRDTHSDLWEACISQLDRLYTRDPEAEGYGIYCAFWFGKKRKGSIPTPPNRINRPKSAKDLEIALRSLIPSDKRHSLEAVVIDVTPPASPKNKKHELKS